MQKKLFIGVFIGAHILFIALLIHKQNLFIDLSYKKQKLEQARCGLLENKKTLTQKLCVLKNHRQVQTYAKNHLGMESINMKQIRKLSPKAKIHEKLI